MKKTFPLIAFLLCLPLLARAADVLDEHGIDRAAVEDSLSGVVLYRSFSLPVIPAGLRAVPPEKRPAVVKALGAFARSFFESKAFRDRYDQARKDSLPQPPAKPRPGAELAAAQKADFEETLAASEAQIKLLPPEQQQMMKETLAEMRRNQAGMADPALLEQMDKERYESEMREYREALAQYPEDPRVVLREQLDRFLELTDGVDYGAKLVEKNGHKRFAREDYEEQSREWKQCFRIGRGACEAARAFAREWRKAL